MIRDWQCGAVRFYLDTEERYARTTFPDGSVVHARPNPGEGEDWWHHDLLHSWLALKMGRAYSATLYDVAHKVPSADYHYYEEVIVLAFIAFLHDPERRNNPDLWRLAEYGDLAEMRQAALLLLGIET